MSKLYFSELSYLVFCPETHTHMTETHTHTHVIGR